MEMNANIFSLFTFQQQDFCYTKAESPFVNPNGRPATTLGLAYKLFVNHAVVWITFLHRFHPHSMVGSSTTHLDMTFGFKYKIHIHETSLRNRM